MQRPAFGNSNALSDAILNTNGSEGNTINGTAFAEITFLNDFKFTSTNSVYVDETRMTSVTNPYYGSYASSNGIVGKEHSRRYSVNYQQLLNYTKAFGLHSITAMVGHEYYRTRFYDVYASKSNMFDPANHELSGAVTDGSNSSYTTDYNTEGYFGRVQYNYEEKYYASASYRRDASSRFHPDNRWGNFWSAGVAWLISKEKFFENLDWDWVDMIKIKASYGSQGNDNIGNYLYVNTYDIVNSAGNPAAVPTTMGNKDITWETSEQLDLGFDARFLNGRLNLNFDWYKKTTKDWLVTAPVLGHYGTGAPAINGGDVENTGIEVALSWNDQIGKDFTYSAGVNMAYNKNEVTRIANSEGILHGPTNVLSQGTAEMYRAQVGYPIGYFWGYETAGVFQNEQQIADWVAAGNPTMSTNPVPGDLIFVDRNGDHVLTDADKTQIGNPHPDVTMGLNLTFGYKGFDLGISGYGAFGHQIAKSYYIGLPH